MKYRDIIGGFFFLAVGLIFSIWAAGYEVGNLLQPGPGFLPLGLGLLLILLSVILLVGARKSLRTAPSSSVSFTSGGWKKVGYAIIVLAVAAFFFEKVGYLLTFFFFNLISHAGSRTTELEANSSGVFLFCLGSLPGFRFAARPAATARPSGSLVHGYFQ